MSRGIIGRRSRRVLGIERGFDRRYTTPPLFLHEKVGRQSLWLCFAMGGHGGKGCVLAWSAWVFQGL